MSTTYLHKTANRAVIPIAAISKYLCCMILYNVTVNIEADALDEWLNWMKTVHIPDVMATGLFIEHRFFRVMSTEHGEGHTYSIQYFLESMNAYETYKMHHAPRLQKEHADRFANRYVAFRTLLETA